MQKQQLPPYAVNLQRAMDQLDMNAHELHKHVKRLTDSARGSTYSSIRQYVSGQVTRPREQILRAAAECLDVREDWLIHDRGPMTRAEEALEEEQVLKRLAVEAAKEPARAALARARTIKETDKVSDYNRKHGGGFANVASLQTWARHGIQKNVSHLPILIEMTITEFVSSVYTTVGPRAFGVSHEGKWRAEDARGDLRVSESDVTAYTATLTQPLAGLAETAADWKKAAAVHSLLSVLYICEIGGGRR